MSLHGHFPQNTNALFLQALGRHLCAWHAESVELGGVRRRSLGADGLVLRLTDDTRRATRTLERTLGREKICRNSCGPRRQGTHGRRRRLLCDLRRSMLTRALRSALQRFGLLAQHSRHVTQHGPVAALETAHRGSRLTVFGLWPGRGFPRFPAPDQCCAHCPMLGRPKVAHGFLLIVGLAWFSFRAPARVPPRRC